LTEEDVRLLVKEHPHLEHILANPSSVPLETLQSRPPDELRWQKAASKIMNALWKHKGSIWFQEPVDPVKFGIMDYNDIITHPMDLGTVKKRLAYNYYPSLEDFASDIRLVWNNCYKYNGEEHEVSNHARELQRIFEEMLADIKGPV
jgi:hypothetical protein